MRFSFSLLCSVCVLSTLLLSGCGKNSETADSPKTENKTDESTPDPSDLLDAQTKKFDDAMSEFMTAYGEAETPEDKQALLNEKLPQADDFAAPLMKIAADYPDHDVAVDALMWIVKKARGDASKDACNKLITDYIDREDLQEICITMSYQPPSAETHSALRTLMTDSPHDFVKGTATYAMANYLGRCKSAFERSKNKDQDEDSEASEHSDEFLSSLDVSEATIRSLYQTAIDDYADVRPYQSTKRKLKSLAGGALFEMDNLAIGQVAPDIEAEDLDGVDFKLSEYRGKVVVIDFWGDW